MSDFIDFISILDLFMLLSLHWVFFCHIFGKEQHFYSNIFVLMSLSYNFEIKTKTALKNLSLESCMLLLFFSCLLCW